MMVAGIGCRKGVTAVEVIAAIDATLTMHRLSRSSLNALATISLKRDQPALHAAAETLGLPLLIPTDSSLTAATPRLLSQSAASQALTGTSSASEAAALAASGPASRLLGPRHILGPVTCAIAISEQGS